MNDLELKTYEELLCQAADCLQFDKDTKKQINAIYREHKRKEMDARKAQKGSN